MAEVYWLEQTEADVPADDHWLSLNEKAVLSRLRFAKRRVDWRLGRWTAKRAVASYLKEPDFQTFPNIEICATPSGAPKAFFRGAPAPVTISLSHRAGAAICAIGPQSMAMGCDLEVIEPRSDSFVFDYFTPEEQGWVARTSARDRPGFVTLLWSAKESALKALGEGLRLDTRSLTASPVTGRNASRGADCLDDDTAIRFQLSDGARSWQPLRVRHSDQMFYGWWKDAGSLLRTVVATPPPNAPTDMKVPVRSRED
jgi:4'-phosphopantetheinyl transferase